MKNFITFIDRHIVVILILPGLIFYSLFLIFPLLGTFILSLTKWEGINIANIKFIGLSNYLELIHDEIFWKTIYHNFIFVLVITGAQFVLSLLLALCLNVGLRLAGFFKSIIFLPQVLAFIAIAFLFKFVFAPVYAQGLLNFLLIKAGLNSFVRLWLGDKNIVLLTLIGVHLWREVGFTTFLMLAGLVNIPQSLYDAAEIDGANKFRVLRHITLPLLREVNIVVITLSVIYALRIFEYVFAMTGGGPNYASEVISTYLYKQAFEGGRMGYSSAISTIFFLIMTIFTFVYLRVTKAGSMRI